MAERITSLQNPRVKHALKLRQRRQRESAGVMLVEGGDELALAIQGGAEPRVVFTCPELHQPTFYTLSLPPGADVVEVSRPVFNKLAYRDNPDGWLAILPAPRRTLTDLLLSAAPVLLVAAAVEKPGNLGAMLRTADAAGVEALIVCDPATDLGNPNVVQASRGTLFTVPVAVAERRELIDWLRDRRISIVAASPRAEMDYAAADLRGAVAIVVGAEDSGLDQAWLDAADRLVRIPMRGRVNSLNVSVSAAILLYEAARQRA